MHIGHSVRSDYDYHILPNTSQHFLNPQPCVWHRSKHVSYINSCNPHYNPVRLMLLLSPWNWGMEQWSDLLKIVMGFEFRLLDSDIHIPISIPHQCPFLTLLPCSLHGPPCPKCSSFLIPAHLTGEFFTLFTSPLVSLMLKSRNIHFPLPWFLCSHSTLFLGCV